MDAYCGLMDGLLNAFIPHNGRIYWFEIWGDGHDQSNVGIVPRLCGATNKTYVRLADVMDFVGYVDSVRSSPNDIMATYYAECAKRVAYSMFEKQIFYEAQISRQHART